MKRWQADWGKINTPVGVFLRNKCYDVDPEATTPAPAHHRYMKQRDALTVCCVADSAHVVTALRQALPAPDRFHAHPIGALLSGPHVVLDLSHVDAICIEWDRYELLRFGALCERFRPTALPLIALGPDSHSDGIAALAVGADRCHPLPADSALLRAQILAHRRRAMIGSAPVSNRPTWAPAAIVFHQGLSVDWNLREACLNGIALRLTARQFEVLAYFHAHHGVIVTRDQILHAVWGLDFDTTTNVVDVYVHHLRRLLTPVGRPDPFSTLRGVGYRFCMAAGQVGDP